jgi:hypothetical protein
MVTLACRQAGILQHTEQKHLLLPGKSGITFKYVSSLNGKINI